jgi:phosphoglycolate phosphatase-like HAD superfamily hydrolase
MRNVDLAVPFDGALDTLRALAERGLRLAAVTSRSRVTSVDSLRHCGLLDALEVVISAEDAEALKPDPRHLQAALSAMGVGCEGAVMVGDTPADIQGGRNLGVHTVAALYGFHGAAVESAQPDDTIDDIRELVELLGERCAFANSGDSLE